MRIFFTLLSFCFLFQIPLPGQEIMEIFSDSILITASKVPTADKKTIKPTVLISSKELETAVGMDLSQVLNQYAGIQINGAFSNPAKDRSVFLRGANSEYTLFLVDGMPINDPSSIGAPIDIRHLSLEQIEKIEIIKGSHSSLYGSDAVAGVINIITKRSSEKKFSVNSMIQTGSFNTNKAQLDLNGNIRGLRYLLSAETSRSEGLSDAIDTLGNQDFNKDGFKRNAYMAKLDYQFNKHLRVTPLFRYTTYENSYDEGAFTDGKNQFNASFINLGLNTVYSNEKLYAKISWNQNLTDRLFQTAFGDFDYIGNNTNVEGFVNWKFNDNFNLTTGIFYTHQSTSGESQVEPWITNTWAPYTNFTYTKNRFQLELSYRYNDHNTFGSNSNYSVIPAFYITNSSKIFVSYNTGFKAPLSAQLFGPFGANPDLLPQSSKNFEVGLFQNIAGENLQFNVNYFRREIQDIIIFTFQYENRDLQKDHGFEIESNIKFNDAIQLNAAYTFVDGASIDNSGPKEERIENLYRRAKHNINGGISYNWNKKLKANLNFIYVGKRNDIFFDLSSFASSTVELEPYLLLNASLNYQLFKKMQLFARVNNLLNTEYTEIYGYSTPGIHGMMGIRVKW